MHGDDVRRRSLAGAGARARRPRRGRRGGNGSDRGRGRASPAQETRGGECREREDGNGARQKPGAPPRRSRSRRQSLPQARLEIGSRVGGRPGANEPVECGVVAGRGTAGRALLEMRDDGCMSALRGRRRIHDPLAKLVAGHDEAAGVLAGLARRDPRCRARPAPAECPTLPGADEGKPEGSRALARGVAAPPSRRRRAPRRRRRRKVGRRA